MGKVTLDKSMSLDGFITGPNPEPDQPLGEGGDRLFAWFMVNQSEENFIRDNEIIGEAFESGGAVIMGKRSFEIIDGPEGWVAPDGTAFEWPVFVLTHEVREPLTKGKTPFTFVSDGVGGTLEQAKAAAGDDKNVGLMGANVAQQFIKAGLVDEIQIHLVPDFLGGGVRLFDHLGTEQIELESTRVIKAPGVTHLRFRVVKQKGEMTMADDNTTDTRRDLVVTRLFDAPIEQVWHAWTDPEHVMQWWGPTGFTSPLARIDFREGGTSLVCMRSPEGQDLYNTWTYRKIVPMRRIEFIQNFSDKDGKKVDPVEMGMSPGIPLDVRHVVTFEAVGDDKTEMAVTEYGYTSDQIVDLSKAGLEQCLDKMAESFAEA
ncbi:MAG: SRPBCC domain-containing protein [Rubrobacteraceae bacterium]